MAGRSGDTYKKRQKEVARAEKQREKTARRMQRKEAKRAMVAGETSPEDSSEVGTEPQEPVEEH